MAELDLMIGKRLQTARRALGFKSARSFARKHGIPESTYSQHETGKRSLNPTILVNYCERLKISPGWLISGSPDTNATAASLDLELLFSILKRELGSLLRPNAEAQFNHVMKFCIDHYIQAVAAKMTETTTPSV